MPITANDPFKGRQHAGELIVLCVRWYLRYPLSYEHVAEMMAERGVGVDASCIWRWVQAYAPELNKRCRSRNECGWPRATALFRAHGGRCRESKQLPWTLARLSSKFRPDVCLRRWSELVVAWTLGGFGRYEPLPDLAP